MTCYSPKIRVELNNSFQQAKDGHWYKQAKIMSTSEYEKWSGKSDENINIQRIPCGNCIGCRLDYSKQWATRCVLEAKEHEDNWFVTITYDPEHLPIKDNMTNEETGEIYENDGSWTGCLEPEDLKNFIKKVRRYWEYHFKHDEIRFFACGEYGDEGQRPHYHIIFFNLPIPKEDLTYMFHNEEYQAIYKSEILEKIWRKGIVSVGAVTFSSCAYVARYVCKKIKGPESEEYYKSQGKIPEFVRMSRKPGIGRNYYEQFKNNIYEEDVIYMSTCKGNILKNKPPRYFDKLYSEDNSENLEKIKENRKARGEEAEKVKFSKTTAKIKDQMNVEAKEKLMKSKVLKRSLK